MADIATSESWLWKFYRAEIKRRGISGIEEIEGLDVNRNDLKSAIGNFDFVHSTGILYHVPNPMHTLHNLATIAKKYLIVNTVVVPAVMETEFGTLRIPDASALFLPALSGKERKIVGAHYRKVAARLDVDRFAPSIDQQETAVMPYMKDGEYSCWPWWWLMSHKAFESAVCLLGFELVGREVWNNHTLKFMLQRR